MKKRVIAMLLAGVMALSLTACGGGDSDKGKKESGKEMKVAMVTDSGDITDQSFNQTTYESEIPVNMSFIRIRKSLQRI